jgi:diguanylate cyclase (GGDEF)-like protein
VKVGDYLFTIPLVVQKNLTVAKVKRENESLRHELERALSELREKNVQLEQSLRRVEEVAATDPLTGLYNRRHFGKVLEQMFAEAQRYDTDLACVMIDLDGYKQLNDAYGHQVGDQILVVAGRVITANMRKMDVAARYGGDEFIVLVPRATADEASQVVQRIREEYRQACRVLLRRNEGPTMSVGIGSLQGDGPVTAEQLVARADGALYRAKESGRNRIILSGPSTPPAAAPAVH